MNKENLEAIAYCYEHLITEEDCKPRKIGDYTHLIDLDDISDVAEWKQLLKDLPDNTWIKVENGIVDYWAQREEIEQEIEQRIYNKVMRFISTAKVKQNIQIQQDGTCSTLTEILKFLNA